MHFCTYPMKNILKFPKSSRILLLTTKEKMEQVEDSFKLVMEEVGDILLRLKSDDEISEKVEQFACYFQKTYIIGTRRAAFFEPLIGNQNNPASEGVANNPASEGLARTNNAVEGWHYGIQSLFSGSHPNVWTFLKKFRQDAVFV